jgi:hypothetical protein
MIFFNDPSAGEAGGRSAWHAGKNSRGARRAASLTSGSALRRSYATLGAVGFEAGGSTRASAAS